jgi:hypothetical protein
MGGVLRCVAVQGRKDEVQQLAAEIRAMLVDMPADVQALWEDWLKKATKDQRGGM